MQSSRITRSIDTGPRVDFAQIHMLHSVAVYAASMGDGAGVHISCRRQMVLDIVGLASANSALHITYARLSCCAGSAVQRFSSFGARGPWTSWSVLCAGGRR